MDACAGERISGERRRGERARVSEVGTETSAFCDLHIVPTLSELLSWVLSVFQTRTVESAEAVINRYFLVGCHTASVTIETCPYVLLRSLKYWSPYKVQRVRECKPRKPKRGARKKPINRRLIFPCPLPSLCTCRRKKRRGNAPSTCRVHWLTFIHCATSNPSRSSTFGIAVPVQTTTRSPVRLNTNCRTCT
jgi:hypothetical protein